MERRGLLAHRGQYGLSIKRVGGVCPLWGGLPVELLFTLAGLLGGPGDSAGCRPGVSDWDICIDK